MWTSTQLPSGTGFCIHWMDPYGFCRVVLGIIGKDGCMSQYITLPVENLHKLSPLTDALSSSGSCCMICADPGVPPCAFFHLHSPIAGARQDQ